MALGESPTLVQIVDEMNRLNNLIVDRGGARTVTPSTSNQTLLKGNYKGDINVAGDSDLISSNIRSGVNIFGVTGTLTSVDIVGGDFITLFFWNDYLSAVFNNTSWVKFDKIDIPITPSNGTYRVLIQFGNSNNGCYPSFQIRKSNGQILWEYVPTIQEYTISKDITLNKNDKIELWTKMSVGYSRLSQIKVSYNIIYN